MYQQVGYKRSKNNEEKKQKNKKNHTLHYVKLTI